MGKLTCSPIYCRIEIAAANCNHIEEVTLKNSSSVELSQADMMTTIRIEAAKKECLSQILKSWSGSSMILNLHPSLNF